MKRKSNKMSRFRLSPNEEAQLVKEELDRRRKLRLQQVREQQRHIAQQVRMEVQDRREKQLRIVADALQNEWQRERDDKLQTLTRAYQESLESVGHAHRSAQENQPDVNDLIEKNIERQRRAAERHREALRELTARRHEEEEQRWRHVEARRKALLEEKKRASKVASLPPPPPNPVESIEMKTCLSLKSGASERFSVTRYHMSESAVEKETETEQIDARRAAEEEARRLEEANRVESRDRLEKLEKARLRGNHALRKEQQTQERTRLLSDLERLQQADLLHRRRTVNRIPAQIFQPLYRQKEIRDEHQRDLEIAFHDMCTEERKVKGDLELQLVPEPLPHPSSSSHDEELDVTLDPEGEEPDTVTEETSIPSRDPGRHALRKLLDRIRTRRGQDQQRQNAEEPTSTVDVATDVLSIESGSLSSRERDQTDAVEDQMHSLTESEEVPEVSDEPIIAGMIDLPEQEDHETPSSVENERTLVNQQTDEVMILRRQREQLLLLEEIEEKRRELERQLKHAQQEILEETDQVHSGIEETRTLPEPDPEVPVSDVHTERLRQYQQRLLEQNRRHKKCVEDARRRLEEYQHTLRLRHVIGINAAAQTPVWPPNVRIPDHRPVLVHPDDAVRPEEQPERDVAPTQLQKSLFSPSKPPSDTIGPSVAHEVPVQFPEATSLDDREEHQPRISEREPVPLPPPSVVLELLRSRQQRAVAPSGQIGDPVASFYDPSGSVQTVQKDVQMSSSGLQMDHHGLINIGEPKSFAASQQISTEGTYEPAPVHRGKAKPPVSRPPARLAFLQQMETHELSAIQEVDTPVNISLNADLSDSSSASLPVVISDGSRSESERSRVTGRISRMSWRETLINSATPRTSASGINQQSEFDDDVPSHGHLSSVDSDHLSSTTISTGSYITSEHEHNASITDSSLSRTEPVGMELTSPKSSRDSIQQIIDKYTKDLNTSLRTGVVHTGENTSSVCQNWSSILQQNETHDREQNKSDDEENHRNSLISTVNLSETNLTDDFLPLQPHPDSSSSSSSSGNIVRNNQNSKMQGWKTVNQIIEHFSNQLSIRRPDQSQGSTLNQLITEPSSLTDEDQDIRTELSSDINSQNNSVDHLNETSHNSTSSQTDKSTNQAGSHDELVLSQLIGRASDIDSSQVLDESSAITTTLQQTPITVGGGDPNLSVGSSVHVQQEENQNNEPHYDTSDCFLSLPTEVTHNESMERSTAARIPLEAEISNLSIAASDWLEPTGSSLASFGLDSSVHRFRSETQIQSKSDLQISMEQLSLTHESICDVDVEAPPTATDVSAIKSSFIKAPVKNEMHDLEPQLPSEDECIKTHAHFPPVEGNALDKLMKRVQDASDVKGILEESTISFISLPESTTSQDHDVIETEERIDGESDKKLKKQIESDESEGKVSVCGVEDNHRSDLTDGLSTFSHAVMMLEYPTSSAQQQEVLLRRRHHLAQRSALRAAEIKAKRAEMKKTTRTIIQNVSKTPSSSECIKPKSDTVCRLKTVTEVKICTPQQKCSEEARMYQRTRRLYSQLEEVKRKEEYYNRQKTNAINREKAKRFQEKTLEKLRAKQKR